MRASWRDSLRLSVCCPARPLTTVEMACLKISCSCALFSSRTCRKVECPGFNIREDWPRTGSQDAACRCKKAERRCNDSTLRRGGAPALGAVADSRRRQHQPECVRPARASNRVRHATGESSSSLKRRDPGPQNERLRFADFCNTRQYLGPNGMELPTEVQHRYDLRFVSRHVSNGTSQRHETFTVPARQSILIVKYKQVPCTTGVYEANNFRLPIDRS